MKTHQLRTFASRIAIAALMLSGAPAGAAPVDFTGRGVFHFPSESGCPPGGVERAGGECNRIALDLPATRAAVDVAAHTIVVSSDAKQAGDAVVGDVLLQGSGVSEAGQRVPLSLQVLLRRAGKKWDLDIYVRAPVAGKFSEVTMDPYQISVREGASTRIILTPERARGLFADPSIARRVARSFVDVRSTDPANPSAADITIALGVGKLSASVLRAGLVLNEAGASGDLNQALATGTWSLELEALSKHIPLWVVQRELFLFGLEDHATLLGVRAAGFKKHDKLTFGARDGKGYLSFNGREAAFDGATASGRAFLQESFMGLILTWRHAKAVEAAARSPDSTKSPRA